MSDESTPDPVSPAEHLSALLDGELPPEQTEFLLARVRGDAVLRGTLARYQQVGDVLRGERVRARPDFALRVSAAIALEPPLPLPAAATATGTDAAVPLPVAVRRRAGVRWLRPVAGLAVAAAVAGIAVVVMQRDPGLQTAPAVAQVAAPAAFGPAAPASPPLLAATAVSAEPASYVTPPASSGVGVIPPAQLASYVVAHAEYTSPFGRHNVLTGLLTDEVPAEPAPAPALPPGDSAAAPR